MKPVRQVLCPLIMVFVVTGCARITIVDGDGSTEVRREWGVLGLDLDSQAVSSSVKFQGFGYFGTPMAHALGYQSSDFLALADDCRLVIWVEQSSEIEELRRLLGDVRDVCFYSDL